MQHDYVIILYVRTGWYIKDARALDWLMWTRRVAMKHPYGTRPCDVGELRRTLVTAERVYLTDVTQGIIGYLEPYEVQDSYGYIPVIR